ncbi:MAG: hypothetical protein AAFR59_17440, partial [Bacteroidota bacterium]
DVSLRGKCVVVAEEITVTAKADLHGTLLFGKRIHFQSGFEGDIQAFALDTLWVEEGVKLYYPSVLHISKHNNQTATFLHLASNSYVQGMVTYERSLFRQSAPNRGDRCYIGQGSRIEGMLYASHQLDLRGEVIGSVTAGNIVHQGPARLYKNYLVDAQINASRLSSHYLAPCIFSQAKYRILTWLDYQEVH